MKPKTIIISIFLALVIVILFNNKEEATFWLFGEIKTSKLLILGVFFILGVIVGAVVFRRKNKHPKEYGVSNPNTPLTTEEEDYLRNKENISDEDREFIRRD